MIWTRRFCGSRTPEGVGTLRSFSPTPKTVSAFCGHTLYHQGTSNVLCALLRKLLVVGRQTRRVGMSDDLDRLWRSGFEGARRGLDDRLGVRRYVGPIPIEKQCEVVCWRRRRRGWRMSAGGKR